MPVGSSAGTISSASATEISRDGTPSVACSASAAGRACVLLGVEEEEVAGLVVADLPADALLERCELGDRPERDPHVELVRELGANAAGRLARGARGERVSLEQDDVGDAELGEVPDRARPDGASADHDTRRTRLPRLAFCLARRWQAVRVRP